MTPRVSHGTKFFGSKIFSYHPLMILFYVFYCFVLQKILEIFKKSQFLNFCVSLSHLAKMGSFYRFSAFSAQQINKTHRIGSLEGDMRKFSSQNFWSHGTPLGSMGQDLRRPPMKYFPNLKSWSYGVHTTALT